MQVRTAFRPEEPALSNPYKTAWWRPVIHFGRHVLLSAALFLLLFAVEIGLTLLLQFTTAALQIPLFTARTLELAEHALVVLDVMLYFFYVSWMGWHAIKEMIQ